MIKFVFAALSVYLSWASGQQFQLPKAKMSVKESGVCGPEMFSGYGMKFQLFRPSIIFDPNQVEMPKEVPVPGCVKIKAKNVSIRKEIRELTAEFVMQIGSRPDPTRPADLPCGRRKDSNYCGCEHHNNTCLFCDFCKQMKAQIDNFSVKDKTNPYKQIKVRKQGSDACECEVIPPGTYELEAEVCTPETSEIYDAVPEDFKERLGSGRPLSMFTTIFLYDLPFKNYRLSPADAGNPWSRDRFNYQLRMRKNIGAVGCYLIASDITLV